MKLKIIFLIFMIVEIMILSEYFIFVKLKQFLNHQLFSIIVKKKIQFFSKYCKKLNEKSYFINLPLISSSKNNNNKKYIIILLNIIILIFIL